MKVLVLNGPNLNLLGRREPEIYGPLSLSEINHRITAYAESLGVQVEFEQTNSEGELVDLIQASAGRFQGLVINAGAYSHTSLAVRDALSGVSVPAIAVHISNTFARERFRQQDLVAGACRGLIAGLGWRGYLLALQALAESPAMGEPAE